MKNLNIEKPKFAVEPSSVVINRNFPISLICCSQSHFVEVVLRNNEKYEQLCKFIAGRIKTQF